MDTNKLKYHQKAIEKEKSENGEIESEKLGLEFEEYDEENSKIISGSFYDFPTLFLNYSWTFSFNQHFIKEINDSEKTIFFIKEKNTGLWYLEFKESEQGFKITNDKNSFRRKKLALAISEDIPRNGIFFKIERATTLNTNRKLYSLTPIAR